MVDTSLNVIWTGDASDVGTLVDRLRANQFVVTELLQQGGGDKIVVDLVASGILQPAPPTTTPAPPAAPAAAPTAMDMSVFGIRDLRDIPQDGEFVNSSDAPSLMRGRNSTLVAFIFLAASLLVFWEL